MSKAGLLGGCPVAGGFFEFDDADPDDPVRQRLIALEAEWRGFLAEQTSAAVDAGDLSEDLDIDQFVWEMCGIYLMHHVSYRLVRDPRATERALTAFGALVARSRRAPTAKKPRATRGRR
jgi:hypothetical protein